MRLRGGDRYDSTSDAFGEERKNFRLFMTRQLQAETAGTRLRTDMRRAYALTSGSRLSRLVELFLAPGVRAVVVFRFGEWLKSAPGLSRTLLHPLYFFLSRRISRLWGITLDEGATIGGGFMVFHFGGIFVGGGVTLGENVGISHDVTLGVGGNGRFRGFPVLGGNIYISPGVVIAGKIKVGSNVKIAPNCVIDKNIPDNCLVHPGPARMVRFSGFEKEDTIPSWDFRNDEDPSLPREDKDGGV
ncbi:MAG: hypothetical protein WB699_10460 [Bacteroidota bacterium]